MRLRPLSIGEIVESDEIDVDEDDDDEDDDDEEEDDDDDDDDDSGSTIGEMSCFDVDH